MKRGSRKLALQRETLVGLAVEALTGVNGGLQQGETLSVTGDSFPFPRTRGACPSRMCPSYGGGRGGQ